MPDPNKNPTLHDRMEVSAVVPTKDRVDAFSRTLASLEEQKLLPAELIVVDASGSKDTCGLVAQFAERVGPACTVTWMPATIAGAAAQRNEGVAAATQPFVWFFDDDIRFEPECVNRLWHAMQSDAELGGVNAMIVNQKYQTPGAASRAIFSLLHGRSEKSFAGRVLGPAVNLLPEDRDDLPDVVPVEWLNTTCTLYRREALPSPPFDSVFTGYSMMEDLTLSLRVGKKWKLANARTARIFHDSQPGSHKSDPVALAEMELANRHYVMTRVMGRTDALTHVRLFIWEAFQLLACALNSKVRSNFSAMLKGKWQAWRSLRRSQDGV